MAYQCWASARQSASRGTRNANASSQTDYSQPPPTCYVVCDDIVLCVVWEKILDGVRCIYHIYTTHINQLISGANPISAERLLMPVMRLPTTADT